MIGQTGDDIYVVDNVADVIVEGIGFGLDSVEASASFTLSSTVENLTLTGASPINATGNTATNVLTGNSAANRLDGGAGADTMIGGGGDDIYVVDSATDIVTEAAAAGTDRVDATITYTLGANVENLTLTGTAAINGTGNTLNNTLTGNSAVNTLSGGAGIDTMQGGGGNDTYIVDNAADIVTEAASAGTDLVQASVSYTLSANVENIVLIGTASINATGNASNNTLTGNSGANRLRAALWLRHNDGRRWQRHVRR